MKKLTTVYESISEAVAMLNEYVDAYESMVEESYQDGDHKQFLKYKSICEELYTDVKYIAERIE